MARLRVVSFLEERKQGRICMAEFFDFQENRPYMAAA
jgi:hypothetical protein